MNNEIKEILDFWKRECIEKDLYFEINPEKSKSLYDYITNLQIKNKELEQIIDIRECQLEEMEMNKTDYTEVNFLEIQLEDYKARNEEAIEYIRSNKWAKDYENSNCRTHLLNILGDKE